MGIKGIGMGKEIFFKLNNLNFEYEKELGKTESSIKRKGYILS